MMVPERAGVALLAVLAVGGLLGGCGDDEVTTPTPDSYVGGPTDPCRLLSQSDVVRITGFSDLQPGMAAAEDECSFDNADNTNSVVYSLETRQSFEVALAEAGRQKAVVEPVKGLGDQAFYDTRSGTTPGAGGAVTYLQARRGSTYISVLVKRGQAYDRRLEAMVADELLRRR